MWVYKENMEQRGNLIVFDEEGNKVEPTPEDYEEAGLVWVDDE